MNVPVASNSASSAVTSAVISGSGIVDVQLPGGVPAGTARARGTRRREQARNPRGVVFQLRNVLGEDHHPGGGAADAAEEPTLETIGELMQLTRERVRQLENQALRRVTKNLRKALG